MARQKTEIAVLAKALLNQKDKVIEDLLNDIEKCDTLVEGCSKVMENWDKVEDSPENLAKQLRTAVKSVKALSLMNRKMAMMLMVYIMGENFSSDAKRLKVYLGKPGKAFEAKGKS